MNKIIKTMHDNKGRTITVVQDGTAYCVVIAPKNISAVVACRGSLIECARYANKTYWM